MTRPMLMLAFVAGAAWAGAAQAGPAPKPLPPPAFEGAAQEQMQSAPEADWWRALGDPLLDRLIDHALTANRDLLAAEAQVRQARALAKAQGWTLLPFGSLTAGAGRQRQGDLDLEGDYASVGAQASWEIDVFGRLRAGARAATADAQGADEARRGVMAAIAAQTASTYADLRGAQARLEAARDNAEAQADTLRLTQVLREAGRGTPLDVMRATAQLEATRAAIPLLEAQIDADVAALDVLGAGLPDALKAELRKPGPSLAPPARFTVGWPETLLKRRPDIRQAEARVRAATARLHATRVDWWPRLSFVGLASAVGVDFASLDNDRSFSFSIGPQIDWPALDFRRNALRTEAARAGAEAEFLRYDQSVLAAVREVETALSALRAARETEARLTTAVEAARQAAEVSRLRYREGADAFFTVLDAERSRAQAEDSLAVARTRSTAAYVALGRALGAGWSDRRPAEVAAR